MRDKLLDELMDRAKEVPYPYGIDVGKYNLTNEEKRYLVSQGFNLHTARNKNRKTKSGIVSGGRRVILIYPQSKRVEDLRRRVVGK